MPDQQPASRYTLKEWIKHPTTIMLIIATNLVWILVLIIVNMGKDSGDDRIQDLSNQLAICQSRTNLLEQQLDRYTTAILFKDGQILVRDKQLIFKDNVIDSLKNK